MRYPMLGNASAESVPPLVLGGDAKRTPAKRLGSTAV